MKFRFATSLLAGMLVCGASFVSNVSVVNGADLANLKGKFVLDGDAPKLPPLKCGGQVPNNCCKDAGNAPEERVVIGKGKEFANIFVYVRMKPKTPVDPAVEKAATADPLVIDNSSCQFVPHASFLYVNQKLKVTNTDKDGHNFKLDIAPRGLNDLIPAAGSKDYAVTVASAGKRPKEFNCTIHTWMKGWMLISDNPYGAVSKADGTFEIKGIPAGEELEFQVWQEQIGFVSDVAFTGGKTDAQGRFKKKLAKGDTDLGTIKIPAKLIK